MSERPTGPYVYASKLFYQMPDGSVILCRCIREPCASQIVAMWEEALTGPTISDEDAATNAKIYDRFTESSRVQVNTPQGHSKNETTPNTGWWNPNYTKRR